MSDSLVLAPVFQITIPVCSARDLRADNPSLAEMWLSLARQFQRTADDLARVVAIRRERASAAADGRGATHD